MNLGPRFVVFFNEYCHLKMTVYLSFTTPSRPLKIEPIVFHRNNCSQSKSMLTRCLDKKIYIIIHSIRKLWLLKLVVYNSVTYNSVTKIRKLSCRLTRLSSYCHTLPILYVFLPCHIQDNFTELKT